MLQFKNVFSFHFHLYIFFKYRFLFYFTRKNIAITNVSISSNETESCYFIWKIISRQKGITLRLFQANNLKIHMPIKLKKRMKRKRDVVVYVYKAAIYIKTGSDFNYRTL